VNKANDEKSVLTLSWRSHMKILVTGALGFVGRHLVHELQAAGHDVIKHDVQYEPDCY